MSFWRLHYHAVWACKYRQELITRDFEKELYGFLFTKANELNAIVHQIGGTSDHIHIVYSQAPKYSISEFIGKIKGASSHWVTYVLQHPEPFDWQKGYGVLSFGDRHMQQVIDYVRYQKKHHRKRTIKPIMEKWSEDQANARQIKDITDDDYYMF